MRVLRERRKSCANEKPDPISDSDGRKSCYRLMITKTLKMPFSFSIVIVPPSRFTDDETEISPIPLSGPASKAAESGRDPLRGSAGFVTDSPIMPFPIRPAATLISRRPAGNSRTAFSAFSIRFPKTMQKSISLNGNSAGKSSDHSIETLSSIAAHDNMQLTRLRQDSG